MQISLTSMSNNSKAWSVKINFLTNEKRASISQYKSLTYQ